MKRNLQILLSGAIALVVIQSSQAVVTLTPSTGGPGTGSWERLKWADSGVAGVTGSGIDASGRVLAWPAADEFRVNDSNDLFAFAVPAGSRGWVDLTDIESNDDGYSVLDFDNGLSTVGIVSGQGDDLSSTVDDAAVTFGDANWASGSFSVLNDGAGGTFQFKLERAVGNQGNVGGMFVQVRTEVIPEPSSSILMLLGLVGLAARRRRA